MNAIPFPENRASGRQKKPGPRALKVGGVTIKASHAYSRDSLKAVLTESAPAAGSGDKSNPKHTFWPRKGTKETMTLEFEEARRVRGVKVYWFDDTGRGGCRVPESWSLEYHDGKAWRPVQATSPYATRRDVFNEVGLEPVVASALRMRLKLKQNFSAGVLRWIPEFD